jgi:hypothetical protein
MPAHLTAEYPLTKEATIWLFWYASITVGTFSIVEMMYEMLLASITYLFVCLTECVSVNNAEMLETQAIQSLVPSPSVRVDCTA